uniref:Uncharacterized protein n=1 Tax=Arion vulgaris TaxID=1028688 RepID=A0A0B7AJL3_9EUPU
MKRFKKINKKSEGQGNYVTRGVTNKVGDLETECCRDVRLGCEAIGEFLHRIVDGSLADNFSLEMAQKQLWENVEKAASDHNVSALLSALVTNTEYAAKDLKEKTQHINIIKDAEALSFAYDRQTGLHDLSSPVSVKKCVEELLLAGNEQHGMRWFKEQEHLNEEWKLSARRDDIMMDISKQVHRIMGNDARNVQLANSYIDAQIQLAEERSVVPCLQAEVEVLMNRIQKAKQERKELRLKHDKIQDFRTLVEKKQNIIGTLVRQNSGALARLDTQKKQVMGYILSRSMNSHATEVHHLTDDLKNSLLTELMKFTSMELACFVTVLLDSNTRQCVLDLSIAPSIHPLARKKLLVYTDVSAAIGFPEYKSTDSLFLHVLQIHDNIQDLDLAKQQRESSVTTAMAAANTTDDISSFVDLCLRAKQHDEKQCEKFLPKLQKRLDVVSAHVNRMVDVKKQVNDWWERPAQFTTPWVVTEGMTFIQWMQRWRVAVTQLHKKTLNDKSSQKKV